MNLRQNYPGVLGIGFSKVFTSEEKDTLIKKLKNEGINDFQIIPDTPRSLYQSIIYIEPFDERNRKVIGFDMSSEPTRKAAIDTARDTGSQAITGKIILLQENEIDKQNGFIIYFPIYKSKFTPESIEEKNRQIDGFVYSPFRAGEFVDDVIKNGEIDELSFKIYDHESNEANFLAAGNQAKESPDTLFQTQNEINVGGRNWVITYSPTANFYKHSLTWWTPIIFLLGLAISVILFFLSLSQSWTNQRLIKTAGDLSKSGEMVENLLIKEKAVREEAERSAKVKDEFLATVSHELRTPLNAISGWVSIIKANNLEQETKDKAISVINKNLRQQVNLIEQMIIFSDLESFLNTSNRQKFSLNELVNECLNESIVQLSKKNLKLEKTFPAEELSINGDKENLKKAVAILLDNSIKFTPQDGEISIELKSDNKEVLFKIIDNGEGILPDLIPKIFEGFRQSDTSITRKHGGLGLSLAITKKIIESHKGKINIESDGLNKGTVIAVTLPLAN